jgi:hypothetical protein
MVAVLLVAAQVTAAVEQFSMLLSEVFVLAD